MAQAWEGREITRWKSRKSLWNKSTIVSLCTTLPTGAVHPLFTLELPMTRTPEEVAQAASTYMMLLNLQRKED
jgi:phosphoenolpyruvate carboxylase